MELLKVTIFEWNADYNIFALAIVAVILTVRVVWCLLFRPFNLFVDYTELGYDSKSGQNSRKKAMVNLALKRRKIGNLPPPYPNSWYAILESDAIKRQEVKEVYALGRNLVAWRGAINGTVFVADAYCPHLGAHLGVGGQVREDCIECPFHKWTFHGSTGKVEDIPYLKTKNMEKITGLQMWHVLEANGFVYIWYHVDGQDPEWYPEEIEEVAGNKWKYHGRSEFQVTCHIQEIPENGADVSHLNALHGKPAFLGGKFQKLTDLLDKVIQHKWHATWSANEDPGKRHESVLTIGHYLNFLSHFRFFNVSVQVKQVGAGIVIMDFFTPFGKGVLVQSVTPMEPLLQRITHRFYSEPKFIRPLAWIVLHSEAIQISRDVAIWNRKCYLSKPTLVKEDSQIKVFRRWFFQFYAKDRSIYSGKICEMPNSGW